MVEKRRTRLANTAFFTTRLVTVYHTDITSKSTKNSDTTQKLCELEFIKGTDKKKLAMSRHTKEVLTVLYQVKELHEILSHILWEKTKKTAYHQKIILGLTEQHSDTTYTNPFNNKEIETLHYLLGLSGDKNAKSNANKVCVEETKQLQDASV